MRNLAKLAAAATLASCALFSPTPAQAATIGSLFNTGVNASGVLLPSGTIGDPHYSLTSVASGSTTDTLVIPGTGLARKIGPNNINNRLDDSYENDDLHGPDGNYNYRTTFDLTGLDPLTAVIEGRWITDNNGLDILINGHSLSEITGILDSSYSLFTLPVASLLPGLNTLDFQVHNLFSSSAIYNPTSLLVEFTRATADPTTPGVVVPLPSTLALFGPGLLLLCALRRRKVSLTATMEP